ncbi:MAG: hypothetical protein ACE5KO_06780 [Candidatus Bathyarchaeia archaeon]
MRLIDRLWWLRFGLAFVAAGISAGLGSIGVIGADTAVRALLIAIVLYILSYYVGRYVMGITAENVPKKRDIIVAGLFPYLVTWFAFWVLFHSLLLLATGRFG